jgi:hypothetical protein
MNNRQRKRKVIQGIFLGKEYDHHLMFKANNTCRHIVNYVKKLTASVILKIEKLKEQ